MPEVRRTDAIKYRQDLYPRLKTIPSLVQRYMPNVENMPPIEINQHNELIDGYHRWTAHRERKIEEIAVTVTETHSDLELLRLAIRRNNNHHEGLSDDDNRQMAIRLYEQGYGLSKEEIAADLSVTLRTVNNYLHDTDKQIKEERSRKIFEMYLACHTQEEIAEAVGLHGGQLSEEVQLCSDLETLPKQSKLPALYQDAEFKPPITNIWNFSKLSNEVKHFGNSEQAIVDNLLYLYTEPFDIVLDPFAGGGSTIDVCKHRLRRYWCSDRLPVPSREGEIRKLDIVQDLPPLYKRWSEVSLTYLDPPYWKQAEGQYSKDAEDLANMTLEDFTASVVSVVKRIASKQSKGAIAMLMQPTQWKAPDRQFTDHVYDIMRGVDSCKKLRVEYRVSCPYSSQQYNEQQTNWAKDNKALLVLTRELVCWRVL